MPAVAGTRTALACTPAACGACGDAVPAAPCRRVLLRLPRSQLQQEAQRGAAVGGLGPAGRRCGRPFRPGCGAAACHTPAAVSFSRCGARCSPAPLTLPPTLAGDFRYEDHPEIEPGTPSWIFDANTAAAHALVDAVAAGDADKLAAAWAAGQVEEHIDDYYRGEAAGQLLILAAQLGKAGVLRPLLALGASLDAVDEHGHQGPALLHAASGGNVNVVRALLEVGGCVGGWWVPQLGAWDWGARERSRSAAGAAVPARPRDAPLATAVPAQQRSRDSGSCCMAPCRSGRQPAAGRLPGRLPLIRVPP